MKELRFQFGRVIFGPMYLTIGCSPGNIMFKLKCTEDKEILPFPGVKIACTNEELIELKGRLVEFMDKVIAAPEETEEQKFERRVNSAVEHRLKERGSNKVSLFKKIFG